MREEAVTPEKNVPPRLSKWETDFLISVEEQWRNKRWLSDKQKEVLGKIWDKDVLEMD